MSRNLAALSESVDFQAFRASLKSELNGQLARETSHDAKGEDERFAALGNAFVGVLTGAVVDQIATPQGIANIAQEKRNMPDVDPLTLWAGTDRVSTGYESIDRFDVRVSEPGNKASLLLIWRRSGFVNWRLSELRILDK
jgi:hypothetical protein